MTFKSVRPFNSFQKQRKAMLKAKLINYISLASTSKSETVLGNY